MVTRKFNSGDWTFKYAMLAEGGLVLKDVQHDQFNLARDIRVVGIWINPEEGPGWQTKRLMLGTEDFADQTADPSHPNYNPAYLRYRGFNAPPPFDIYTQPALEHAAGVQAVYRTRKKVFGNDNDSDDDYLTITQSFIFTKYGKEPAHEPGGVLNAARIFPLVKFSYGGKKVKSIRVDYRFEVALDLLLDPFLNTGATKGMLRHPHLDTAPTIGLVDPGPTKLVQFFKLFKFLARVRPMLAGIFRDKEEAPASVKTEDIFYAAEKPVPWEVIGRGLIDGIPGNKLTSKIVGRSAHAIVRQGTGNEVADNDKSTWDNIHMWSNYRLGPAYLKKQPSAPGAFHAFHCHWRWPDVVQHPDLVDRLKVFLGNLTETGKASVGKLAEEQFQGIPLNGHIGGPLLDPLIPTQTIHFAITMPKPPKGKPQERWDAEHVVTTEKFEELFFDTAAEQPRDISGGKRVLTWISIKATKSGSQKPFTGTVFAHGIYFAHNVEMLESQSAFAKTIGETLQKPKYPKPTWSRSPNRK